MWCPNESFREEGVISLIKRDNLRPLVSLEGGPVDQKLRPLRKGCCLVFWCPPEFRGGARPEEGMLIGAGVYEGHMMRLVLCV